MQALDRTGSPEAAEQSWIVGERVAGAQQRDHEADDRDAVADARDVLADERERLADAREAELDAREARLAAGRPGPSDGGRAAAQRAAARAERERRWAEREAAAAGRTSATARRTGAFPALDPDAPAPGAGASGDDDELGWGADKRDFVADWRDYLADSRDAEADARDALADERDLLADAWEAELDRDPDDLTAAERAQARALREEARRERGRQRSDRLAAATARTQAAQLRTDATPATGLAMAFAEIARHLYDAANLDDVLTRITGVAVATVPGCVMATITVRQDDGALETLASTHRAAAEVDRAQFEAGEGPSVAAVAEPVVLAPAFPDSRWPVLGARPAEAGVRSAVSFGLAPSGPATDALPGGSLSAYADAAEAFDDDAREIGLILAAHASIAVRAVGERGALEQLGRELHAALSSRDVIGQAKGILMERLRITPEDAFDTLRRSSQRLNVKLREIAEKLAETGELDTR